MSLDEYRAKRDFRRTSEPLGQHRPDPPGWRFVVQKHQAGRLHYDLRLELDGVLKSWAVPKGPSLDPAEKRLAVATEDHPLEYAAFEGVIPQGEYGAGAVMIWDEGSWRPVGDPRESLEKGELKFELNGHKLQGKWMLVHTGRRARDPRQRKQWLLFKERDAAARTQPSEDVLEAFPLSAVSHRSLQEIAQAPRAVWDPQRRPEETADPRDNINQPQLPVPLQALAGAVQADLPQRPRPCLPTAVREAPSGEQWLHEIKYDGYRMLAVRRPRSVRFLSRNGNDWSEKFPTLAAAIRRLPAQSAILDGEVAVLGSDGATDFQALQNAIHARRPTSLRYFAFDLLYLDGYDLTSAHLEQRRMLLRNLLSASDHEPGATPVLVFSEAIQGDGPLVLQQACQLGVEGIVSKRLRSRYVTGRSDVWVKVKCLQRREFLVGGYTLSTSSPRNIGALVLGAPSNAAPDQLRYCGRVGTGFTEATLAELGSLVRQHAAKGCPFEPSEVLRQKERDTHWLRPELIVEVEFAGWTSDGLLRFASYRGLRDDLRPEDVVTVAAEEPSAAAAEDASANRSVRRGQSASSTASQARSGDVAATMRLTHADRVVYPKAGITKVGVASYYAQVAPWMLEHVKRRPLTLVRCPRGCDHKCFFQKHAPKGMPESVRQHAVEFDSGQEKLLAVDQAEALLALVQFNVLEFHVWPARLDRVDRPDAMILDLDPDASVSWSRVTAAAYEIRSTLQAAGLRSFVKTTGGKGLHILTPLMRRHTWTETRALAELVARILVVHSPGRYTVNSSKQARQGKIYIDCHRNTRGATAVAAYSTRARPDAGVSTPLAWEELEATTSPLAFTLDNITRRLKSLPADPWAEVSQVRQSITKDGLEQLQQTMLQ